MCNEGDAGPPHGADGEVVAALVRLGLVEAGAPPRLTPLAGGVASDIWKVETPQRCFCVKRALAKLRVAADWRAPVERNAYEVGWFEVAGRVVPDSVPRLHGHAPEAGLFAMDYLDPARYRPWKAELLAGRVDPDAAGAVGARLVRIHAATADDAAIARRFASDTIFHAIRLEPYLEAAARAHPDVAPRLHALVRTTAGTRRCLVHGDVSPKNILLGPGGPVFLDAECAWFGDPAFDLAFCLNHLLLKALVVPQARPALRRSFDALLAAYSAGIAWEPPAALRARAAALLPGLLLARVDGKSPVEYLTRERDGDTLRRIARRLLVEPPNDPDAIRETWRKEFEP